VMIADMPPSSAGIGDWLASSAQILLASDALLLDHPRIADAAQPSSTRAELPVFSGAHHKLPRILW